MRAEEWRSCLKDYSAVDDVSADGAYSLGGCARATLGRTVTQLFSKAI